MCRLDTVFHNVGDRVMYQPEGWTPCVGTVTDVRWIAPHDCASPHAIKRYQRCEVHYSAQRQRRAGPGDVGEVLHTTEGPARSLHALPL